MSRFSPIALLQPKQVYIEILLCALPLSLTNPACQFLSICGPFWHVISRDIRSSCISTHSTILLARQQQNVITSADRPLSRSSVSEHRIEFSFSSAIFYQISIVSRFRLFVCLHCYKCMRKVYYCIVLIYINALYSDYYCHIYLKISVYLWPTDLFVARWVIVKATANFFTCLHYYNFRFINCLFLSQQLMLNIFKLGLEWRTIDLWKLLTLIYCCQRCSYSNTATTNLHDVCAQYLNLD